MRIVFMGTPAFAATILDQLVQAYDVVGVFTQPDAVRSRGKKLEPSPVKQTALSHENPGVRIRHVQRQRCLRPA